MEIKKEDVLKAHENGCPDVKNVLEVLFPKVFEVKINEDYHYAYEWEERKYKIVRIGYEKYQAVCLSDPRTYVGDKDYSHKECIKYINNNFALVVEFKTFDEFLDWLDS
jgi:hypothetical protein